MNLKDYLTKNSGAGAELARASGLSEAFISMLAAGKRRPSAGTAKLIEEATKGTVTRMELLYPDEAA